MVQEFTAASPIGIVGGGTMGTGIAQLAVFHGHRVILSDVNPLALEEAQEAIHHHVTRLAEKGTLTSENAQEILRRLTCTGDQKGFQDCHLIIEAVFEDLETKKATFRHLEREASANCVFATNTSSLSVTALAAACQNRTRFLGLHFFHPAPQMPLVEVVPTLDTSEETLAKARTLLRAWGKSVVVAQDTPGFIVNRIARPFYGEALRILEEAIADAATIDWAMKEIGGFPMGPFELMDFIGNDVNLAVTERLFAAFFYEPRFRPSLIQKRLVDAGYFGRKTGRGYYDYRPNAENPTPHTDPALGKKIFSRILVMLINEAAHAVFLRVASVEDIDFAMTSGVHYPKGLLRWADDLGVARVVDALRALHEEYGEERYRPHPLLRRMAREGGRFYPA